MENNQLPEREVIEEPPPIFGSWRTWYCVVIGTLIFLIALLTWFTNSYR